MPATKKNDHKFKKFTFAQVAQLNPALNVIVAE
jgi:hypothetical protein